MSKQLRHYPGIKGTNAPGRIVLRYGDRRDGQFVGHLACPRKAGTRVEKINETRSLGKYWYSAFSVLIPVADVFFACARQKQTGAAKSGLSGPLRLLAAVGIVACLTASPALADPCKAIPDKGPLPAYLAPGRVFSGPVSYVGDGDSLCVDIASTVPYVNHQAGDFWIEVRLADFYAPELHEPGGDRAKLALARITAGNKLSCTFDHRSYDRAVAVCRIGGVSVGDLMRRAGIREGGRGQ